MKIAVLVSGNGTNLQALIDAQSDASKKDSFEIVLVVADRDCYALERAQKAGIPSICISVKKGMPREEARKDVSDHILSRVLSHKAQAIVLAGFLTIMKGQILEVFSGKIVNLHPALLPKFGGQGMWGHHVHDAVLASGETESGCTIHLVDAGCDTGPILLQKKVPVLCGDTAETLAQRISEIEHIAIVEGTRLLAQKLQELACEGNAHDHNMETRK